MTICLITPPSCFLLDERVFVSLGILKIAAVLEQYGHTVEVVDLSGIAGFEAAAADHAATTEAKVFGITATTPQMPAVSKIVAAIRGARRDARLILGGPHVTLVAAALKREKKLGVNGRSTRAWATLEAMFDTLVTGDGEDAIFVALDPNCEKWVDADKPSSRLFLSDDKLNQLPWPARHLVDVDSYHYSIEGHKALSLIAQLGCLTAGTQISKTDGTTTGIENLVVGDKVLAFNTDTLSFEPQSIVKTWEREANDVLEIRLTNGSVLEITCEHPVLTEFGWKHANNLREGDAVVCALREGIQEMEVWDSVLQPKMRGAASEQTGAKNMSGVQKGIYDSAVLRTGKELVLLPMSVGVAEGERKSEMVEGWTEGHERQVGSDDSRRTGEEIKHKSAFSQRKDHASSEDIFRHEEGESEPNEKTGGCSKGIRHDQKQAFANVFRSDEENMEVWEAETHLGARGNVSVSKQVGSIFVQPDPEGIASISLCWKRRVLDWAMSVWKAAKSRLYRQGQPKGDSFERGVLAQQEKCGCGAQRLRSKGLEGASGMVQGIEDSPAEVVNGKAKAVWTRIKEINFLGTCTVYNITVCPTHSYIANSIVVHNCPFACGFCGGRESPMLRRIRTRTTENIVREVVHLHTTYGVTGIMFYDDELNVNQSMVELMNALADAQYKLGAEFRMRGFIKSQLFTDEQAASMYRAGFRWILVGFESGSERILENINKKANRSENTRCMEIAKRHNLKVKALMSMGHPGESEQTVQDSKEWLLEVKPDDFDMTVITTYPGTPYFDWAVQTAPDVWTYTYPKNGDRLHAYDVEFTEEAGYYKGRPGEYSSFVFTDHLAAGDLVHLRDNLELDVRAKLNIPFNQSAAALKYEHAMGQGLPGYILKTNANRVLV